KGDALPGRTGDRPFHVAGQPPDDLGQQPLAVVLAQRLEGLYRLLGDVVLVGGDLLHAGTPLSFVGVRRRLLRAQDLPEVLDVPRVQDVAKAAHPLTLESRAPVRPETS